MRGGIEKPSPVAVRKSATDGRGVADETIPRTWLRVTELGSITEASVRHAGARTTTGGHAEDGDRSEVQRGGIHPPPAVKLVKPHDAEGAYDSRCGASDDEDNADDRDGGSGRETASGSVASGQEITFGGHCGGGGGSHDSSAGVGQPLLGEQDPGASGGATGGGSRDSSTSDEERVVGEQETSASGGVDGVPDAAAAAVHVAQTGVAALGSRRTITCTTGDAALRAGVVHAVTALGRYRILGARRSTAGTGPASTHGHPHAYPEVFVVGRRPRRSVRLLVAMARGCWVVSDTWLLDSLHARSWQSCAQYVPRMFAGVPAARAAARASKSLFNGLSIGWCGKLDVPYDDFCALVEVAGGLVTSFRAAVVVQGRGDSMSTSAAGPRAVLVNQRWLPDSLASWQVLAFNEYKPQ